MNIDKIINANMTVTDHLLRDAIHAVCVDVIMEAAREEREACALVLDKVIEHLYLYNYDGDASTELRKCAAAIRARGEK